MAGFNSKRRVLLFLCDMWYYDMSKKEKTRKQEREGKKESVSKKVCVGLNFNRALRKLPDR
jgi:hypothetical protein